MKLVGYKHPNDWYNINMKITTARLTGVFYLGFVITGILAIIVAKEKLYVDGDATATLVNLVDNPGLARFGVAAEVAMVGFQALTAMWFFKLFRAKDSFIAGLIAVFGMVNAIVLLIASAMWLSALNIATSGGQADIAYMLLNTHENIWLVASIFFGLWLIPMAYMTRKVKMPSVLSWFLIAGGVGYILSTFTALLLPNQTTLADVLPIAATFGEFWIIGYLLFKKVRL